MDKNKITILLPSQLWLEKLYPFYLRSWCARWFATAILDSFDSAWLWLFISKLWRNEKHIGRLASRKIKQITIYLLVYVFWIWMKIWENNLKIVIKILPFD